MRPVTIAVAITGSVPRKKDNPALPVLLATGYSSAAERAGSEFPIIRKPYEQQTLGVALPWAIAACSSPRD